ncbi:type IV-A pilus assembly ATPase PilB [Oceanisphaera avium]|uniref:Type IV-A pilus assembly ATPase PilB n=1 Tax=Oceanisphaera avium TaxID=1903694 RepID=A0A1Y0CZY0_9GAMM|nr:type IV-A pilus assembly ATPase PilB [Oceanisphaera avium]ART80883.1 type IV-A pilus assembly ATPase PilB [Oceanisphaera avium]
MLNSSGLAQSLLAAAILEPAELELAMTQAQQAAQPLISVLIEHKLITSYDLAHFCSQHYGLALIDLTNESYPELPKHYLSLDLIERHHVLPTHIKNNILYLATSDPSQIQAQEDFSFRFNIVTELQLVEEEQLALRLTQLQNPNNAPLVDLTHDTAIEQLSEDLSTPLSPHEQDDGPLVQYIHQVLLNAVRKGASDIHFEPYEHFYRIRFRIDGLLYDIASPPKLLAQRFAARLKVMAKLDIAERRLPQDGRIKLSLNRYQAIDLRVSSMPIQAGEKIVLRLLNNALTKLDIHQLGLNEQQKEAYLTALHLPQGLILVTGPTGSGKTVSLYTGLNILNTVSCNISSAEDPIEIVMPGINQLQINPKAGLGFAQALRAFLRQDPDIIMVGEIRDLDTADMALKAAQTGHLVLSTLHTNSAIDTLTRLTNMGLATYNIVSAVSLIIAQRLARQLCPHCKAPITLEALHNIKDCPDTQLLISQLAASELVSLQQDTLYQATGCAQCTEGYKGRIGVYEVLVMDNKLAQLMLNGADSLALSKAAEQAGMLSLRNAALNKVKAGVISLTEANRITQS